MSFRYVRYRVRLFCGLSSDVQSAFARCVLNKQLGALALYDPEETHHECDTVFNDGKNRLPTENSEFGR